MLLTLLAPLAVAAAPSGAGRTAPGSMHAPAKPAEVSLALVGPATVGAAGSPVSLRGVVTPARKRRVVLQQLGFAGGDWVSVKSRTTSASGSFRFTAVLPEREQTFRFRVLAPPQGGARPAPRAVSDTVFVDVFEQQPRGWRSIVPSGSWTTCGIGTDGSGWCWGINDRGQVGDGTQTPRRFPYRLPGRWRELESIYTTCGVKVNDTAWCWGDNVAGDVGDGTTEKRLTPYRLPGRWRTVQDSCGVRTDGTGWCWGSRMAADGSWETGAPPYQLAGRWTTPPTRGCHLRVDRSAWCWGDNTFGQLGNGSNVASPTPVEVRPRGVADPQWQSINGQRTVCGILVDGTGYCWGNNRTRSVGWNDRTDRWTPYKLPGRWRWIRAGETTCGIRTDDTLWCWGRDDHGQVGTGDAPSSRPGQVPGTWRSVVVNEFTHVVCGVTSDRRGRCWGANENGAVGNGSRVPGVDVDTPYELPGRWLELDVTAATCGLRTDHSAWCWGSRYLGDGTAERRTSPTRVLGSGYTSLHTSRAAQCLLRADKSAWCWGSNSFGEVGNGSYSPVLEPYRLNAAYAPQ